eukprot:scaffold48_cov311-Pinguiococcus_pyrenoidosus.AAC.28
MVWRRPLVRRGPSLTYKPGMIDVLQGTPRMYGAWKEFEESWQRHIKSLPPKHQGDGIRWPAMIAVCICESSPMELGQRMGLDGAGRGIWPARGVVASASLYFRVGPFSGGHPMATAPQTTASFLEFHWPRVSLACVDQLQSFTVGESRGDTARQPINDA